MPKWALLSSICALGRYRRGRAYSNPGAVTILPLELGKNTTVLGLRLIKTGLSPPRSVAFDLMELASLSSTRWKVLLIFAPVIPRGNCNARETEATDSAD